MLFGSRALSRIPGWYQLVADRLISRYVRQLPAVRWYNTVIPLNVSDLIHRKIRGGTFEIAERRVIKKLLNPGDVAMDIGAHCGFMTIAMAARVGKSGAVHAFEPVPENFQQLLANVEPFGEIVNPCNYAIVGSAQTTLKLGRPELWKRDETITSGNYSAYCTVNSLTTEAININSFLNRLDHLHLLKIDTEGMEPEILSSISQPNLSKVQNIMFETVLTGSSPTPEQKVVIDLLQSNGFVVRYPWGPQWRNHQISGISFAALAKLFRFVLPVVSKTLRVRSTTANLIAFRHKD